MKGILLAGGLGTRLYPVTKAISKQLLPIHDKPLIYYPMSVLMLAGIRDILIITTPEDVTNFKKLLGNGSKLGINLQYEVQDRPNGIAEALIIGEKFIGSDNVCLILGDNIFYGQAFKDNLNKASLKTKGASIFCYKVSNPKNFGVVGFDKNNIVNSLEEKPSNPKSNYAVTGLYFYDNKVVGIAKKIKPSSRGELEITDINKVYLKKEELNVNLFGRGFAWLDTGTHESLLEASHFVRTIEKRQGFKIACIEEIAYQNGWISKEWLKVLSKELSKTEYGKYLFEIASGRN